LIRILPQTLFRFRYRGIHLPSALQCFNVREIRRCNRLLSFA
jgi:hypothetical protein